MASASFANGATAAAAIQLQTAFKTNVDHHDDDNDNEEEEDDEVPWSSDRVRFLSMCSSAMTTAPPPPPPEININKDWTSPATATTIDLARSLLGAASKKAQTVACDKQDVDRSNDDGDKPQSAKKLKNQSSSSRSNLRDDDNDDFGDDDEDNTNLLDAALAEEERLWAICQAEHAAVKIQLLQLQQQQQQQSSTQQAAIDNSTNLCRDDHDSDDDDGVESDTEADTFWDLMLLHQQQSHATGVADGDQDVNCDSKSSHRLSSSSSLLNDDDALDLVHGFEAHVTGVCWIHVKRAKQNHDHAKAHQQLQQQQVKGKPASVAVGRVQEPATTVMPDKLIAYQLIGYFVRHPGIEVVLQLSWCWPATVTTTMDDKEEKQASANPDVTSKRSVDFRDIKQPRIQLVQYALRPRAPNRLWSHQSENDKMQPKTKSTDPTLFIDMPRLPPTGLDWLCQRILQHTRSLQYDRTHVAAWMQAVQAYLDFDVARHTVLQTWKKKYYGWKYTQENSQVTVQIKLISSATDNATSLPSDASSRVSLIWGWKWSEQMDVLRLLPASVVLLQSSGLRQADLDAFVQEAKSMWWSSSKSLSPQDDDAAVHAAFANGCAGALEICLQHQHQKLQQQGQQHEQERQSAEQVALLTTLCNCDHDGENDELTSLETASSWNGGPLEMENQGNAPAASAAAPATEPMNSCEPPSTAATATSPSSQRPFQWRHRDEIVARHVAQAQNKSSQRHRAVASKVITPSPSSQQPGQRRNKANTGGSVDQEKWSRVLFPEPVHPQRRGPSKSTSPVVSIAKQPTVVTRSRSLSGNQQVLRDVAAQSPCQPETDSNWHKQRHVAKAAMASTASTHAEVSSKSFQRDRPIRGTTEKAMAQPSSAAEASPISKGDPTGAIDQLEPLHKKPMSHPPATKTNKQIEELRTRHGTFATLKAPPGQQLRLATTEKPPAIKSPARYDESNTRQFSSQGQGPNSRQPTSPSLRHGGPPQPYPAALAKRELRIGLSTKRCRSSTELRGNVTSFDDPDACSNDTVVVNTRMIVSKNGCGSQMTHRNAAVRIEYDQEGRKSPVPNSPIARASLHGRSRPISSREGTQSCADDDDAECEWDWNMADDEAFDSAKKILGHRPESIPCPRRGRRLSTVNHLDESIIGSVSQAMRINSQTKARMIDRPSVLVRMSSETNQSRSPKHRPRTERALSPRMANRSYYRIKPSLNDEEDATTTRRILPHRRCKKPALHVTKTSPSLMDRHSDSDQGPIVACESDLDRKDKQTGATACLPGSRSLHRQLVSGSVAYKEGVLDKKKGRRMGEPSNGDYSTKEEHCYGAATSHTGYLTEGHVTSNQLNHSNSRNNRMGDPRLPSRHQRIDCRHVADNPQEVELVSQASETQIFRSTRNGDLRRGGIVQTAESHDRAASEVSSEACEDEHENDDMKLECSKISQIPRHWRRERKESTTSTCTMRSIRLSTLRSFEVLKDRSPVRISAKFPPAKSHGSTSSHIKHWITPQSNSRNDSPEDHNLRAGFHDVGIHTEATVDTVPRRAKVQGTPTKIAENKPRTKIFPAIISERHSKEQAPTARTRPTRSEHGTFRRPRGTASVGYAWNAETREDVVQDEPNDAHPNVRCKSPLQSRLMTDRLSVKKTGAEDDRHDEYDAAETMKGRAFARKIRCSDLTDGKFEKMPSQIGNHISASGAKSISLGSRRKRLQPESWSSPESKKGRYYLRSQDVDRQTLTATPRDRITNNIVSARRREVHDEYQCDEPREELGDDGFPRGVENTPEHHNTNRRHARHLARQMTKTRDSGVLNGRSNHKWLKGNTRKHDNADTIGRGEIDSLVDDGDSTLEDKLHDEHRYRLGQIDELSLSDGSWDSRNGGQHVKRYGFAQGDPASKYDDDIDHDENDYNERRYKKKAGLRYDRRRDMSNRPCYTRLHHRVQSAGAGDHCPAEYDTIVNPSDEYQDDDWPYHSNARSRMRRSRRALQRIPGHDRSASYHRDSPTAVNDRYRPFHERRRDSDCDYGFHTRNDNHGGGRRRQVGYDHDSRYGFHAYNYDHRGGRRVQSGHDHDYSDDDVANSADEYDDEYSYDEQGYGRSESVELRRDAHGRRRGMRVKVARPTKEKYEYGPAPGGGSRSTRQHHRRGGDDSARPPRAMSLDRLRKVPPPTREPAARRFARRPPSHADKRLPFWPDPLSAYSNQGRHVPVTRRGRPMAVARTSRKPQSLTRTEPPQRNHSMIDHTLLPPLAQTERRSTRRQPPGSSPLSSSMSPPSMQRSNYRQHQHKQQQQQQRRRQRERPQRAYSSDRRTPRLWAESPSCLESMSTTELSNKRGRWYEDMHDDDDDDDNEMHHDDNDDDDGCQPQEAPTKRHRARHNYHYHHHHYMPK